ncbi:unnamed protein product [Linum tenue]|uniref:Small EDRK-rich factor-like N-terminal domain-containing protein n=1 Tax=Linum tenue TaxID=586396 RepID=A0AAV0L6V5_9ROSI|nr:unnamed protein product [Linum tenue]
MGGGNGQKAKTARERNLAKAGSSKGSQLDSNKKAMSIQDYDATLDLKLDSIVKFVLQCLAFYQVSAALYHYSFVPLYTASEINTEFSWFDIDHLFKENWCKRLHPENVREKVYGQPPLLEPLKSVSSFCYQKGLSVVSVSIGLLGWRLPKLHKRCQEHGVPYKQNGNIQLKAHPRMARDQGEESMLSVRIEAVLAVAQAVAQTHQLRIALQRQISEPCDPVV